MIADHLPRVLASFGAPDPFTVLDAQDVVRRTFARLYDEASIPGMDGYPHGELAPGIVEMLVLDLPDTVFWWNGTSYEQLTHVREDGTLTLDISPKFQAVLATITMDS